MTKILRAKFFLSLWAIAFVLSGCSQRFAFIRPPEKVMYAQGQNLPARENIDNKVCEEKLNNAIPYTEAPDIKASKTLIAAKTAGRHTIIYLAKTLKVNKKQAPAKVITASEEHSSRKALILRALFYALIAAILLVAFIKLTAYANILWVVPALFLITVAFLIAFFLGLVCMISFFKAGKHKDTEQY